MNVGREQMDRLLAQIEREAYARGWADAIATLQEKAAALPPPSESTRGPTASEPDTQRGRGRPATYIGIVRDIITTTPGLKGAEIVRESQRRETPVEERTVRSCLRRLKGKHVWQREGRWYPKKKTEVEPINGEAFSSAPH